MPSNFQHCRVMVNKLADTPHQQGQIVLKVSAVGRVVTISFDRGSYLAHVGNANSHMLVGECRTVDAARDVALELLKAS